MSRVTKIDETKSFIDFDVELRNYTDVVSFSKEEFNKAFQQFKNWNEGICFSNFSAGLFSLMSKADIFNLEKFLKGFPEHTVVYLLWYESPSEDEFYEKWGNIKIEDVSETEITIIKTCNVGMSEINATPGAIIENPTSELIEDLKSTQIRNSIKKDLQ